MNSVGKKTLSDEADDDTEPQNDVDPQQQQKANTLISSQPIQRAIQGKNDTIQCNPTLKRCRHYCRNGCDNCCRCCAASDTSAPVVEPCSECVKDIVFQKLVKDGFTTQQAHEIQEDVVILTDSAGSETTVPSSQAQDRLTRLHSNKKILYHQTSEDSAKAILESKQFRRGSDGMAGPGIYFATSPEATRIKATEKGPVIKAEVLLGRSKTIDPDGDKSITFSSLLKEGYDSVMIPRRHDPFKFEFAVYNCDQVNVIGLI